MNKPLDYPDELMPDNDRLMRRHLLLNHFCCLVPAVCCVLVMSLLKDYFSSFLMMATLYSSCFNFNIESANRFRYLLLSIAISMFYIYNLVQ